MAMDLKQIEKMIKEALPDAVIDDTNLEAFIIVSVLISV